MTDDFRRIFADVLLGIMVILIVVALVMVPEWVIYPGVVFLHMIGVTTDWLSPQGIIDVMAYSIPWTFLILGSLLIWLTACLLIIGGIHWCTLRVLRGVFGRQSEDGWAGY